MKMEMVLKGKAEKWKTSWKRENKRESVKEGITEIKTDWKHHNNGKNERGIDLRRKKTKVENEECWKSWR